MRAIAIFAMLLIAQPAFAGARENFEKVSREVRVEMGQELKLDGDGCFAELCEGSVGPIRVMAAGNLITVTPTLAASPDAYLGTCVIALAALHGEMSYEYAFQIARRGFERAAVMNKSRETFEPVTFDVHTAPQDQLLECTVIRN
tara:strand:- start:4763 stop:5197 length:435 start_codon:yes stop_codon:yes gene_type:complete